MAETITEMIIPGTYIDVRAEGLIGVSGIATGNVGIVGTAAKGPVGVPTILSTFGDARDVFGDYDPWVVGGTDELTLVRALQQAFGNGASTVYAVRCGPAAAGAAAAATRALLKGANSVLTLTAKTPGTWAHDVTAQVKAGSANGFVEALPVTALPLGTLHAGIFPSGRNAIRVTKGSTGQTFRYALLAPTTGGPTSATKGTTVLVNATGVLTFHADDLPVSGDTVVASYEVAASACVDVVLRYGPVTESYTGVDATDLARDMAASTLVGVAIAPTQDQAKPDLMPDPLPLAGGSNGETASPSDYATGLATLDFEPVNIVALAGQPFADAQVALQAHVETAENGGRERIAVVGADADLASTVAGNADSIGNDRVILVAPGIVVNDIAAGNVAALPPAYSAAAVAGLVASLAVQVSPTNKTLAVSGLTTNYNDGQLKLLLGNRVMPLERRSGFRVVKGITTDDGPFRQVSVRRIVDFAKAGTRIGSLPYIGRLNNSRVRGALQATLNGFLASMVLDEALTEYSLAVTATREQEIAGVALVTMVLKPTFSIDFIKVVMNLS